MNKNLKTQIEKAVRDAATGSERNWTVRLFADGSIATTYDDDPPESDAPHIVVEQSDESDWKAFVEDCIIEQIDARQAKYPTEDWEEATEHVMESFIEEECKDEWGDLLVSLLNWTEIEDFCDEQVIRNAVIV